ncbi:Hint domain-containing protein [Chryseobacterium formosus]|uniref:Hint domain-containing protein n=1 Tax=Chryseobacterium formosus TaxID=1537363 RepID=A0ABT3XVN4_9FLAO|nr:Hint domain-containing protein [Chryseobacterium formosus]MCX8525690.1 Hint domain-containing protein [Chryseobacterium formosus]
MQNKFELWNYNNELAAWKKMSYEEKLQRVRTDVTLQELNQAIKGDAQAMAELFTLQASLGGSGLESGITRRIVQRRLRPKLEKICFVAGTLISTAEEFKKIEDIEIGNLVWSYNELNKNKELKKVVSISLNESREIIIIKLGNTKIECTPEHPFYVDGKWVEAGDLRIGDELFGINNQFYQITSLIREARKQKVYNFEVEDNHNYYISDQSILVHNNCDFVRKLFANNINDIETFSTQLKKIGNPTSNITKNPGLANAKIPGLDLNSLPSWTREQLTSHLGGLMENGTVQKPKVEKFMKSFNKAFEKRSTGGNLGKKQ